MVSKAADKYNISIIEQSKKKHNAAAKNLSCTNCFTATVNCNLIMMTVFRKSIHAES